MQDIDLVFNAQPTNHSCSLSSAFLFLSLLLSVLVLVLDKGCLMLPIMAIIIIHMN